VPAGIAIRRRIACHVPIAIQPIVDRIGRDELPGHRIVVARLVVIQPRGAIGPLPGVAQRRGTRRRVLPGREPPLHDP
jgi:hypothetical protein